MFIFKIFKKVVQEISGKFRKFFWNGNEEGKRLMCMVNWSEIEFLKEMGGFGVGLILERNIILLVKWIWRFETEGESN